MAGLYGRGRNAGRAQLRARLPAAVCRPRATHPAAPCLPSHRRCTVLFCTAPYRPDLPDLAGRGRHAGGQGHLRQGAGLPRVLRWGGWCRRMAGWAAPQRGSCRSPASSSAAQPTIQEGRYPDLSPPPTHPPLPQRGHDVKDILRSATGRTPRLEHAAADPRSQARAHGGRGPGQQPRDAAGGGCRRACGGWATSAPVSTHAPAHLALLSPPRTALPPIPPTPLSQWRSCWRCSRACGARA